MMYLLCDLGELLNFSESSSSSLQWQSQYLPADYGETMYIRLLTRGRDALNGGSFFFNIVLVNLLSSISWPQTLAMKTKK